MVSPTLNIATASPASINTVPSLVAEGISKAFKSGIVRTQILAQFSLSIQPRELTLISGPSGCGKSTLLSILSGLQPADNGRVMALGQDLSKMNQRNLERFRLLHTGFVFQGFNLFSALTACEQVELPLTYMGIKGAEAHCLAMTVLDEVGMARHAHLRPGALSGGEKQRIAIARALVKTPKLLFADEPTSALDASNGQVVIDLLHRIARDHGTAVLCVSHDPRLIQHADRILTMEDGVINCEWRSEDSLQSWPRPNKML